jgi:hypothetical protein
LAGKGSYSDADGTLKTAGIFIGPEFGTVTRVDLVEAARECIDVDDLPFTTWGEDRIDVLVKVLPVQNQDIRWNRALMSFVDHSL